MTTSPFPTLSRLLDAPRGSRPRFAWAQWMAIAAAIVLVLPGPSLGYIPAQATNETAVAQQAGLNFSDVSKLSMLWYPMGSYSEQISYQLVGADSSGISKGALVHFSEDKLPNATTTTPWIALVSCDANSTNASQDDDIFTLARDRGAVAALLYSLKSVSCYINPEYSNPANFDQVMDIFATQSLSSSKLIESQFDTILGNSSSKYYWFSPSLLNDSQHDIQYAIANNSVPNRGYLFATLTASNATDPSANNTGSSTSPHSGDGGSTPAGGNTNTSLAMIILYAITGCVSALFCIVIISGAIRAIRHPERYGPRSGDTGPPGAFGAQSRARGLTRAILDTFPVVKFGRADAGPEAHTPGPAKDIESAGSADTSYSTAGAGKAVRMGDGGEEVAVELREWNAVASCLDIGEAEGETGARGSSVGAVAVPTLAHAPAESRAGSEAEVAGVHDRYDRSGSPSLSASSSSPQEAVPRPAKASEKEKQEGEKDVVPDAIGRETCPICIVDFEEGDDLRVLPCEGHHRFHQECVDQWLLELSSSCPLCRQDFQALQTMMAAGEEAEHPEHSEPSHAHAGGSGHARPISSAAARFSKYLRTARRHRQRPKKAGRKFFAFYNCGDLSGASQPHKHVQFLPIDDDGPPVERLARSTQLDQPSFPFSIATLPYANHVRRLPSSLEFSSPDELVPVLADAFLSVLDLAIQTVRHDASYPARPPPFNVLLTLEHVHFVPRRFETHVLAGTGEKLSVNALGFAGMLLVKSERELAAVKEEGVGNILRGVALEGGLEATTDDEFE
ncbi:hypothetical protein GSI_01465 [Ganoderma sinense ZZ0214-1]|uniref:RING-type domain-containing protein n=1 Tax=Ganoderma sinense ZZ0214-1 TaxID=1077348 RepID=A0A2G8SPV8_9APHY|nr:hypothetical protein GSI_01465 [Ganoderma sinense ZZ0214-1]